MRLLLAFALLVTASIASAESPVAIPETDPTSLEPLQVFKECDVCPEMIVLPLGSFIMGGPPGESRRAIHWDAGNIRRVTPEDPYIALTEGPLHKVTIDLPIAMGRNEVTVGEWKACVADGGCGGYMPPDFMMKGRKGQSPERIQLSDRHPVLKVSYNDMQLYLGWLNTKVGASVYRLPTEAEWEYAARSGTQSPFAQGEEITTDQANFGGNATAEMLSEDRPELISRGYPVSVDDLDAANAWGLRHMSGNALERTMSCWTERHTDWPTSSVYLNNALNKSCDRVAKGGDYAAAMDFARPAVRGRGKEDRRSNIVGFRIVRELNQKGSMENE